MRPKHSPVYVQLEACHLISSFFHITPLFSFNFRFPPVAVRVCIDFIFLLPELCVPLVLLGLFEILVLFEILRIFLSWKNVYSIVPIVRSMKAKLLLHSLLSSAHY